MAHNVSKLPAFLADARSWEEARAVAAAEEVTDWALLCRAADTPCAHGETCAYHKAVLVLWLVLCLCRLCHQRLICVVAHRFFNDSSVHFATRLRSPQAASAFFDSNAHNFERSDLAAALRSVLVSGPSKTARVPFLVGPTNTGKSTLVEPFDALFGWSAPCCFVSPPA